LQTSILTTSQKQAANLCFQTTQTLWDTWYAETRISEQCVTAITSWLSIHI